jgi:very-short-patch-repair endonuclease
MIQRRRQHDNEFVRVTDEALLRVCDRWGARLAFKQRIADVLELDASNSSFEEGRFALQAHFDFVVWRSGDPQFAVEFDEPHHRTDANQRRRDALKDEICWRAGFPVLRAVDHSLKRLGERPLLEWLIELWFVYHDHVDRERRENDLKRLAEVPDDWTPETLTDGQARWMTEFSWESPMDYTQLFIARPDSAQPTLIDPFADAREHVELWAAERWTHPEGYWSRPVLRGGWVRGAVVLPVSEDAVLIGEAEVYDAGRLFIPDALLSVRIAQDLATLQISDFLDLYQRGRIQATSMEVARRRAEELDTGRLNFVGLSPEQRLQALLRVARRIGLTPTPEDQREALEQFIASDESLARYVEAVEREATERAWGVPPEPPSGASS